MKKHFNRVLSMICIMTMLLSCICISGVQASGDVQIITAQFLPYDQELRVLANIPEGYTAKVLVDGTEITTASTEKPEGTLLTSANFVPSVYGIVPVTLEASNGTDTLSATQNVKFVKAFSTKESAAQNFDSLEPMTMETSSDSTVVNAVNALNDGTVAVRGIPYTKDTTRYTEITNTYTPDNSSALTMKFQATATSSLPSVRVNPAKADDGGNGIIETSYDLYTDNQYIRQTIYPVSGAYSSALTFVTQDGSTFASSFPVIYYSTFCFGSSDKPVEANTWYNIRFLINVNDLTFEFYVDDELINYGNFTYNNSQIGKYIYRIDYADLACGTQGKAGASSEEPVNVTFDNIKLTHTNIGASVSSVSYTASEETTTADAMDAKIPSYANSITAGFDNAFVCTASDVTLQKEDGTIVEADVTIADGDAYASEKYRSLITVAPKQTLSSGEYYKIVLAETAKFGSTAYGAATQIPFLAVGFASIVSPASGANVNVGDALKIKAYTPDCTSGELYINDEYVASLTADASEFMSYDYNTTLATAGEKEIKLVLLNNDGTTLVLTSSATLSQALADIIPLETFENTIASDYFSVAKQASASSAEMSQEVIDGRNAVAFNFVGGTGTNKKVIQVQKKVDTVQTGRVALEFDMYLAYENRTAELSMSFGDGTYTFYPLDVAKQFSKGKIGGNTIPYYGWHKVKLVMDTVDQSSQLYFDGVQVGETCYTFASAYHKADVADPTAITGFNAFTISLWQGQAYTNGEKYLGFAVDNWHVYQERPLPIISDVVAYNSESATTALAQNALAKNDITKVEMKIANSKYISESSLTQNFKVLANGNEVAAENVSITDGVLTFDVAGLPENADVKFVIAANTLSYDNLTSIGLDSVFGFKTPDANGIYSKRNIIVDTADAKAIFTLDALSEKTVSIIIAGYNGNKLESVIAQPVTVDGAKNLSLSIPKAGITEVKAFVWTGTDTLVPLSAGEVSTQIASQN